METPVDFRTAFRTIAETELVYEVVRLGMALEYVVAARDAFWEANRKAGEAANAYAQARLELLFRRWHKAGKGWCTVCQKVAPKDELRLLYCAKRHLKENWVDEKRLHTACTNCFDRNRQCSGRISANNQFLAFEAREGGDGRVSICSFGDWIPLPGGTSVEKFSYISYEVAREWKIPPDISFSGFGTPTLRVSHREVDLSSPK